MIKDLRTVPFPPGPSLAEDPQHDGDPSLSAGQLEFGLY